MDAVTDTKENETRAFINTAKKRGIDLVPAGAGNTEPTSAQEAFGKAYRAAFFGEGEAKGNYYKATVAAYEATKHLNKPLEIRNIIKSSLITTDFYDNPGNAPYPDFKAMWKALEAEVEAANEAAKTEHTKSILQVAMLDITEQAKDITEELNNPTVGIKEAITSAQKGIEILHDTLDGVTNDLAQVTIKRERSPQEMIAEATDGTDVYACGIFNGIEFKHGTLSFIGARTSRGKTTAMTSVAVDALQSERRILFLTLEETDRQILRRLIMCLAYMNAYDKGDTVLLGKLNDTRNPFYDNTERGKLQNPTSPLSAYKAWEYRLTHRTNRIISPDFASAMDSAYKQVEAWYGNNRIVFHNGAGEDFRPLVTATRQAGNSDIILFDYAQLAPANGVVKDSYGKKIAVDETDKALLATAREKGCVVIAGAQFNRADTTKDDLGDDVFSDKSFADCGNMETDAHILIGIGWNDCNHDARFYKVLKNREGNGGDEYALHFKGAYSFMYGAEKREVIPADSKRPQMWEALKKAVDKGKSAAELGNIVLRYMGKSANKSKGSGGNGYRGIVKIETVDTTTASDTTAETQPEIF